MKNDQIKEINQHISDALKQCQNVMLKADADEWACCLEYTAEDLFNALYIFNHVAQNIGIKNKTLDVSNVEAAGAKLRETVKILTGYDPRQLVCNDKTVS